MRASLPFFRGRDECESGLKDLFVRRRIVAGRVSSRRRTETCLGETPRVTKTVSVFAALFPSSDSTVVHSESPPRLLMHSVLLKIRLFACVETVDGVFRQTFLPGCRNRAAPCGTPRVVAAEQSQSARATHAHGWSLRSPTERARLGSGKSSADAPGGTGGVVATAARDSGEQGTAPG